ncbi:MAG: site-specific integrase, partial [Deltaproteobacteria bacterium]|nr:site-specific integrase [Deltaproteobacteria bacterium]
MIKAKKMQARAHIIDPLIDEYLLYVRIERRLAENTVVSYAHDLRLLASSLAEQHIHALAGINETSVTAFLTTLHRKKLSSRSVARIVSAARSFFHYL